MIGVIDVGECGECGCFGDWGLVMSVCMYTDMSIEV